MNRPRRPSEDTLRPREALLDNAAYLVIDLGRLLRRNFDNEMADRGLSRAEWYLLAHLVFFDGSTQQELADVLDVTKGGMAKMIDRLEARQLVRRCDTPRNGRRAKRIVLTTSGQTMAMAVDAASVRSVSEAFGCLNHRQRVQLNGLLRTVRAQLQRPVAAASSRAR